MLLRGSQCSPSNRYKTIFWSRIQQDYSTATMVPHCRTVLTDVSQSGSTSQGQMIGGWKHNVVAMQMEPWGSSLSEFTGHPDVESWPLLAFATWVDEEPQELFTAVITGSRRPCVIVLFGMFIPMFFTDWVVGLSQFQIEQPKVKEMFVLAQRSDNHDNEFYVKVKHEILPI